MMQRTYETRLPGDPDRDPVLIAYADLYGRAERTLFARLRAGEPLVALKRAFLVRFGLTARQFNALPPPYKERWRRSKSGVQP